MDRISLVRLRWRLSGAWLWPTFLILTVVDAVVVHNLPPTGDSEGVVGAWLLSTALMLLCVAFLSPFGAMALRRVRSDLPRAVARNYAGTFLALTVSAVLAVAGIVNHGVVSGDRSARLEATQRAAAWIGDHAPPQFQDHLRQLDTIAIQTPQLYRACVTNGTGSEDYCVVVDVTKPFGAGVTFAGHESNELLGQGTG